MNSFRTDRDPVVVNRRHLGPGPDGHSQFLELRAGRVGQVLGVGTQHPCAPLDQDHPRRGRVDVAEIARQGLPRHLGQRPGKLDARRARPDDHERHPRAAPGFVRLALGNLKSHQDPLPNAQRVFQRLEARAQSAHSSWPK